MLRTTIKSAFMALTFLLLTTTICSAQRDTSIFYYKAQSIGEGFTDTLQVSRLADADYFRVVYPTETFNGYTVNEFYKDGKRKLLGTTIPHINKNTLGVIDIEYEGDVATYYPDGKKQSITHYIKGVKDGDQYLFYPDGKVYCYLKNSPHSQWNAQFNIHQNVTQSLLMDCYDKSGNMICQGGNGNWITYSPGYDKEIMRGAVKNGYKEGKWDGNTYRADSIKYSYAYHKGNIDESIGYDRAGTAYPFKQVYERADCAKGNVFSFIDYTRNHVKLPAGTDDININIDTMHVCFIIEKNGTLSDFHVLGDYLSPEIKGAFAKALKPNSLWTPGKYYGVPFRTRMILPLRIYTNTRTTTQKVYTPVIGGRDYTYRSTQTSEQVFGQEKMLDF
jgi:hypothetical protein